MKDLSGLFWGFPNIYFRYRKSEKFLKKAFSKNLNLIEATMRHFVNPYQDYNQQSPVQVDRDQIISLIENYVATILRSKNFTTGDL